MIEYFQNKIENSIPKSLHSNDYRSYYPTPLLTIDSSTIHKYIGFDNTLILSNPKVVNRTLFNTRYDINPYFIGKNIIHHDYCQNSNGMQLNNVPCKKLIVVVKEDEMDRVLVVIRRQFLEIKIPLNARMNVKKLNGTYVGLYVVLPQFFSDLILVTTVTPFNFFLLLVTGVVENLLLLVLLLVVLLLLLLLLLWFVSIF